MTEIDICFNGAQKKVASKTVEELLEEFHLGEKKVAVERNRIIVPRAAYATTPVCCGDQIEIVHFVGGG